MSGKQPPRISVDGVTLDLVIERKRIKNVNARLLGSTLRVSAPYGMSQEALDEATLELAGRLVRRAYAIRVNAAEDALELARKIAAHFPEEPVVERVAFVTTQRRSWGSYSPETKTVRLNAALRRMPRWVLEAVVAHELVHAFHPDHSPAFWRLLRGVCPDTDRAEAFLAGVSWLAHHHGELPSVERELLGGLAGQPKDERRSSS